MYQLNGITEDKTDEIVEHLENNSDVPSKEDSLMVLLNTDPTEFLKIMRTVQLYQLIRVL